ncbi:uncharacterized protein LOC111704509 [Eurytemora carolleeae]|uniref:uncharacterized protein LOC111704509 n=1 Tax=Eurytemora carolleeae TaxID=1294199 RepID=UPI000C78856C|nr:uncharacterized protein LOC111704509 [Eurytemora carolleeae]|eukprot:XP_023332531.1 uncharacterized protein LOC111704509 [Eurytemora affinis]
MSEILMDPDPEPPSVSLYWEGSVVGVAGVMIFLGFAGVAGSLYYTYYKKRKTRIRLLRKIRATELYDSVLVRPGYVQQENVLQPIPEQYTKNDVFTVPTQQPPFSNNFHFSQMY